MPGHAYVTLGLTDGRMPRVGVSLYPDASTVMEAKVLRSGTPMLRIQHGDTDVTLWPYESHQVTEVDIATARRLVEAATTYLADLERIHADQQADQAA